MPGGGPETSYACGATSRLGSSTCSGTTASVVLRRATAVATLIGTVPTWAWACSGPGAMAAIERAERIGWQLFGVTAGLALIAAILLRRWRVRWQRLMLTLLPVVVHPGWWLTARGGDCGAMRLLGSYGVTAVGALVLAVAVVLTGLRRHRARPN